jgi:hypothetical protein
MHLCLRLGGARDRNFPSAYTKAATGIQNAGVPRARFPMGSGKLGLPPLRASVEMARSDGNLEKLPLLVGSHKIAQGRDIPRQPGVTAVVKSVGGHGLPSKAIQHR